MPDKLDTLLTAQAAWLFLLALPIACISWTVTQEEVFKEPREYCRRRSEMAASLFARKFFYVFTCEYCFSHYVAIGFLALTGFHLLVNGWQGYLIAWLAVVWLANLYMSIFGRLRLGIKSERVEIELKEETRAKDTTGD
jgi:hypothetical protein